MADTGTLPGQLLRDLSPEQDFRLRIARNDLQSAHDMELAGASPSDMVQLLGALRSSLLNVLAIVDDLTSEVTL